MLRLLQTSAVFACVAWLMTACSSEKSKSTQEGLRLGDQEYIVLDGTNLLAASDTLSGQGSVVFKAPLGEIDSSRNLLVRFSLADAGTLAVRSYADDKLENGIAVTLSRAGSTLNLAVTAGGVTTEAHALTGIDAAGDMTLAIDIHNGENPAHIIVWNGDEASPTAANALYNSGEAHDHDDHGHGDEDHDHADDDHDHEHKDEIKGRGTGTFWGVVLNNATVLAASARGALGGH